MNFFVNLLKMTHKNDNILVTLQACREQKHLSRELSEH